MTSAAQLRKGYLPLAISLLSILESMTNTVLKMIQKTSPAYVQALPNMTQLYGMKLSFPVLFKNFRTDILFPYEIETTSIATNDLNEHSDSYTRDIVTGSYIVISNHYYIQLRTKELGNMQAY